MIRALSNVGSMQWGEWFIGLWGAFISAAAGAGSSALGTMVVDPDHFNIHAGLRMLLEVMFCSAMIPGLVSLMKYLQMHPTPDRTVREALASAAAASAATGAAIGKAQDAQAQTPKP